MATTKVVALVLAKGDKRLFFAVAPALSAASSGSAGPSGLWSTGLLARLKDLGNRSLDVSAAALQRLNNTPPDAKLRRYLPFVFVLTSRIKLLKPFPETFFRAASGHSLVGGVEIRHSSSLSSAAIRTSLTKLTNAAVLQHRYGRAVCFACLPLSLVAGFLPGPNFFLAYNLVRLSVHSQSLRGAQSLRSLLEGAPDQISFTVDANLDDTSSPASLNSIGTSYRIPSLRALYEEA
jgi:hypothetical protein